MTQMIMRGVLDICHSNLLKSPNANINPTMMIPICLKLSPRIIVSSFSTWIGILYCMSIFCHIFPSNTNPLYWQGICYIIIIFLKNISSFLGLYTIISLMKKTLIIHDTFLYRWGGERLIIMMANALNADIASGFFSEWSYDLRKQGFTGKMIPLMSPWFLHDFSWLPAKMAFVLKNGLRHFGLKWAFSRNAKKLKKDYDIIIMSGDCLSAVKHFKRKKII